MQNKQSGFGLVGVLIVIVVLGLIAGSGWIVLNKKKPSEVISSKPKSSPTQLNATDPTMVDSTYQDLPPESYSKNQSTTPGKFINNELGIAFTYPKSWKVINESDHLGILFRLQSEDFSMTNVQGMPYSYKGTQITVAANSSHLTFAEDKALAFGPQTLHPALDVKEISVSGKNAFSYKSNPYETALESFTVEIAVSNEKPVEFIFQPSDGTGNYTEKDKPTFDSILESITYL